MRLIDKGVCFLSVANRWEGISEKDRERDRDRLREREMKEEER